MVQSRGEINISTENDGEIAYTPNEEKFDPIVNDITLELNDIALELSNGDTTDIYEAGDCRNMIIVISYFKNTSYFIIISFIDHMSFPNFRFFRSFR